MSGPASAFLPDGRLHLQHGPIDLVVLAEGAAKARALDAARGRFATILAELVAELPRLRCARADAPEPRGAVARRMTRAARRHQARVFVTPMAAVAGAVADEVLAAMQAHAPLSRAMVNNGGDIALHLSPGRSARLAIAAQGAHVPGSVRIDAATPVRGVATSGHGGRSLSLGIADAVTALARSAAEADVAATLIANAVDLPGHPAIARAPADSLRDDSDLGAIPATVRCGWLCASDIDAALGRGVAEAERMLRAGLIEGAALFLRGAARAVGGAHMTMTDDRERRNA